MIDQIDKHLKEWAENTLDGPTFSLTPPSDTQSGRGVSFYLLELVDAPPPRSAKRPPLQLSLRYLVTTWADKPEEAHRLLGELVFAAMENSEFEVELDPIPATTWAAFGVAPRPSFVLRVPLRKERLEPATKLVREPLVVRAAPITSLHGIVLGPDDVPLAEAIVELPTLQLSTRTDRKGRFHFMTVPGESSTRQLRVRAKGRELNVTLEQPTPDSEPLVIRFDLFD